MAGEKLTKRVVDALKAPEPSKVGVKVRESFVWDRELRGFGVQVMPSGLKSFVIHYRTPEGRHRRVVIGRYGLMTVEEDPVLSPMSSWSPCPRASIRSPRRPRRPGSRRWPKSVTGTSPRQKLAASSVATRCSRCNIMSHSTTGTAYMPRPDAQARLNLHILQHACCQRALIQLQDRAGVGGGHS